MAFQIIYHQRETTQERILEGDRVEIGRSDSSDIFLGDLRVGWHHATIERMGTAYVLTDAEDDNGTYVNGKVIETHQLANNDRILIGPYTLRIRLPAPGDPLRIDVEEPQVDTQLEGASPIAYRAMYKLSSSGLSKGMLITLGVVVVLGLSAWAFGSWFAKGKLVANATNLLSPGAVSSVHHFIENDCQKCHAKTWQVVTDQTCETCHKGTVHHKNQSVELTPDCTTCHQEHRGRHKQISQVPDRACTQCHANLQERGLHREAALKVVEDGGFAIRSFTDGHPEFSVLVRPPITDASKTDAEKPKRVRLNPDTPDNTPFLYNHEIHLKPLKHGPKGTEQLECADCHQLDVQGAYMKPISFEDHCERCHQLEFDEQLSEAETAPHGDPEMIRKFLLGYFTQSCMDRVMGDGKKAAAPSFPRRRPGRPAATPQEAEALAMRACLDEDVARAESTLFGQQKPKAGQDKDKEYATLGCRLCHIVELPISLKLTEASLNALGQVGIPNEILEKLQSLISREFRTENKFLEAIEQEIGNDQTARYQALILQLAQLPTSEKEHYQLEVPKVPEKWFEHGLFVHEVHERAEKECKDCHAKASESIKRDDLLLPNIATCQECHSASGGASHTCVTCHDYHGDHRDDPSTALQKLSKR